MGDVQHGLRDFSVVVQRGPPAGEPDQDAAGAGNDLGGHFDRAGLPCRGMSLAERVLLATLVEAAAALMAGQCFGGNLLVLFCRRRIGHGTPQSHQQVVGGTVQVESKQIRGSRINKLPNFTRLEIRNPKHETRNSKQIINPNLKCQKPCWFVSFLTFVLWICFGFRISCLGFVRQNSVTYFCADP